MNDGIVLRGGRVVDPSGGIDRVGDIAMSGGVFVDPVSLSSPDVVDVSGLVVAPGFIDAHVHFRDPGQTVKEDVFSGAAAAAGGGFTCVLAMPNTLPVMDEPAVVRQFLERVGVIDSVRILQSAALTRGRGGKELTDFQALKQAGAAALTDDGTCIQENGLMLEALQRAKASGLAVIDHCEDESISTGKAMNQGECSVRMGVAGQSRVSEDLIVARNMILSREAQWPVHCQHLSTAGSVELLRWAQAQGIAVTGEVCPHHLCLTDDACQQYGPNAKMNPPLRTEVDRQALIQALADNVISVIATDHAPHTVDEKAKPIDEAPFGIIGLEAAVSLCLTELYHTGVLPLSDFISKFTVGPRELLGLPYGTLELGAPADVTLLDLDAETVIDVSSFKTRGRNCPYDGWQCKGKAVGTLVAGKWGKRMRG